MSQKNQSNFVGDYMVLPLYIIHIGENNKETKVAYGNFEAEQLVIDPVTGYVFFLFRVATIKGEMKQVLIPADQLTTAGLRKYLAPLGIVFFKEQHAVMYALESVSLLGISAKSKRTLIRSTGWFSNYQGYYTGQNAIVADEVNPESFWFASEAASPFRVKGSLEAWKEKIGRYIEANPLILGITCIAASSLFLNKLGLGTMMFNIHGLKGSAKTLATQCAASLFGCGIDPSQGRYSDDPAYIVKFATTVNGIETILGRYSPMPIFMDEMTEADAKVLHNLLYKLSSGAGKHRMTSQMAAAELNTWQLNIITTAERSIVDAVSATGQPVLGGQRDRAVDIPVTQVAMLEYFIDFKGFSEATHHLKQATAQYYGSGGEAMIRYAINNPGEVNAFLDGMAEIETELTPPNCGPGEQRVVKRFAAAVLTGYIAIMAGVLECAPDDVLHAMKTITQLWWSSRSTSLTRIAEFLENCSEDEFLTAKPSRHSKAKAYFYDDNIAIPDVVFHAEFGVEAKSMLNEFETLGALRHEQAGRRKSRFDNNQVYAYVIDASRVRPLLNQG